MNPQQVLPFTSEQLYHRRNYNLSNRQAHKEKIDFVFGKVEAQEKSRIHGQEYV